MCNTPNQPQAVTKNTEHQYTGDEPALSTHSDYNNTT